MTVLTYICFLDGSVQPSDFARLANDFDLGFEPESIEWRPGGARSPSIAKGLRQLSERRSPVSWCSISSSGLGAYKFELAGIAGWPADVLVWVTPGWPDERLISAATRIPGFTCALVGDSDDVYWQSETQPEAFASAGKRWRSLPLAWDAEFQERVVDTSKNVGRRAPALGLWLWAAAKMWFGPGAANVIDLARLREFSARKPNYFDGDTIVVELFDLRERLKSIRREQARFREWMQYDMLERNAVAMASAHADPALDISTGSFPHGGTKRVTMWCDAAGIPVRRSHARRAVITEYDASGKIVWHGAQDS